MEDIRSGWLVKSPGARYVNILKGKVQFPVKAKWRRRFFKLYRRAVDGISTQVKFSYYQDESLNKKLGSIKLADCVKVQSSLDSSCYQHLFALQTCTNNNRVYYLAADTAQDMNGWVSHLCQLCELIDDPRTTAADNHSEKGSRDDIPASEDEHGGVESAEPSLTDNKARASFNERLPAAEDYDFPPNPVPCAPESPLAARTSMASSGEKDEDLDDSDLYENANGIVGYSEDVYDVQPSNIAVQPSAPPRPPKPTNLEEEDEEAEYTNVQFIDDVRADESVGPAVSATSSQVTSPGIDGNLDEIYDVPKNLFTAPPTFCHGPSIRLHKYINASTQLVDTQGEQRDELKIDPINDPVKPPRDTTAEHLQDSTNMESQDVYDTLPSARPLHSLDNQQSTRYESSEQSSATEDQQMLRISQTSHTRSYVRDSATYDESANKSIELPQRTHNSSCGESSSEDTASLSDTEQIYENPPLRCAPPHNETTISRQQTTNRSFRPLPSPRSPPIAAPRTTITEYVDLEHSPAAVRVTNRALKGSDPSSVQYVELDPQRTAALKAAVSDTAQGRTFNRST